MKFTQTRTKALCRTNTTSARWYSGRKKMKNSSSGMRSHTSRCTMLRKFSTFCDDTSPLIVARWVSSYSKYNRCAKNNFSALRFAKECFPCQYSSFATVFDGDKLEPRTFISIDKGDKNAKSLNGIMHVCVLFFEAEKVSFRSASTLISCAPAKEGSYFFSFGFSPT